MKTSITFELCINKRIEKFTTESAAIVPVDAIDQHSTMKEMAQEAFGNDLPIEYERVAIHKEEIGDYIEYFDVYEFTQVWHDEKWYFAIHTASEEI